MQHNTGSFKAPPPGLERSPKTSGKQCVTNLVVPPVVPSPSKAADIDSALLRVIERWSSLSDATRKAVANLIEDE